MSEFITNAVIFIIILILWLFIVCLYVLYKWFTSIFNDIPDFEDEYDEEETTDIYESVYDETIFNNDENTKR